jgi:hypothetical protein
VYTLVLPKLALISKMTDNYTGPGVNLAATGSAGIGTCSKTPADRMNATITVLAPGPGLCDTSGDVSPGNYNLTASAVTTPADVFLTGWDCYDIRQGRNDTMFAGFEEGLDGSVRVALTLGDVVTCVADWT